jgi:hypothetical protein
MTFAEYYVELQKREGNTPLILVEAWPHELISEVESDLRSAVAGQKLKGTLCSLRPNSSNQSIGNQVEEFVMPKITAGLASFKLERCVGAGYPDRMLSREGHRIAMEVKATSDWNPADSNRRVLTSSSEKLRKHFRPPIHHLLCTVFYSLDNECASIGAVRLDFLEPSSPVSVRLEVSVSHKLLATGQHHSFVIQ